MTELKTLNIGKNADGRSIEYRKVEGRDKNKPGVVFLHGYQSSMNTKKAEYIEKVAMDEGFSFIRFNREGVSTASDEPVFNFSKVTFQHWVEDCLTVIDHLTEGPQVLVGSSLGGWLGLLCAIERPQRIKGLVLIAPAINFLRRYISQFYPLCSEEGKKILDEGQSYYYPSNTGGMLLNKKIAESSEAYELDLTKSVPVPVPVRILHGMKDVQVPYRQSLDLTDALESGDVDVTYRKSGHHSMGEVKDNIWIMDAVRNLF